MVDEGVLVRDTEPSLYLYQVDDGGRLVTGLVCTIGIDDYLEGTIRSHELTRRDKEEDRTRHIEAVNAQTGLVFLFYRDDTGVGTAIDGLVPRGDDPGCPGGGSKRHPSPGLPDPGPGRDRPCHRPHLPARPPLYRRRASPRRGGRECRAQEAEGRQGRGRG